MMSFLNVVEVLKMPLNGATFLSLPQFNRLLISFKYQFFLFSGWTKNNRLPTQQHIELSINLCLYRLNYIIKIIPVY